MKLEKYIDHTYLRADAIEEQIKKICNEAIQYQFYAICINPCWIEFAYSILKTTNIKIASVVGFPLGANNTYIKIIESEKAIKDGANEIDMVMNIGKFKDKDYNYIINEIKSIKNIIQNNILKVIVETALLNNNEKKDICKLLLDIGVDYIKTSTGFSKSGAHIEDIKLFKTLCGEKMKIKASGGIKTKEQAIQMINAGASRIGTSSSINIMEGN